MSLSCFSSLLFYWNFPRLISHRHSELLCSLCGKKTKKKMYSSSSRPCKLFCEVRVLFLFSIEASERLCRRWTMVMAVGPREEITIITRSSNSHAAAFVKRSEDGGDVRKPWSNCKSAPLWTHAPRSPTGVNVFIIKCNSAFWFSPGIRGSSGWKSAAPGEDICSALLIFHPLGAARLMWNCFVPPASA